MTRTPSAASTRSAVRASAASATSSPPRSRRAPGSRPARRPWVTSSAAAPRPPTTACSRPATAWRRSSRCAQGHWGRMVALRGTQIVHVPFEDALGPPQGRAAGPLRRGRRPLRLVTRGTLRLDPMVRALQVTKGGGPAAVVDIPDARDRRRAGCSSTSTWSSLNYKDALAITGRPGVIRADRLIAGHRPGRHGARVATPRRRPRAGERVRPGRDARRRPRRGRAGARRLAHRRPARFTTAQAAAIGTAGYTAACAFSRWGAPPAAPSTARSWSPERPAGSARSRSHCSPRPVTRSPRSPASRDQHDYLRGLGATTIVERAELESPGKPLQSERWAGGIDTVGGPILANVLSQTRYGGTVAACGIAGAPDVTASMMPFILRGVTLAGVNSVFTPPGTARCRWHLLDRDLDTACSTGSPHPSVPDAVAAAERMLAGETIGRIAVDVRA